MTIKGTWTLYFDTTHGERIEVNSVGLDIAATGQDPDVDETENGLYCAYVSGMVRIFPWASIREARWEPAE